MTNIRYITEDAAMQATKSNRGGRREPLPKMTIVIPNYAKYQEELKPGKRRHWVRFDRSTASDIKITACRAEARWVFIALVMISDEGTIANVTMTQLAKAIDIEYRTLSKAIDQLAEIGLIGGDFSGVHREFTVSSPGVSRDFQVNSLEQSANDAASSALQTDRQTYILPPTPKGESVGRKARLKESDLSPEFIAFMKAYPKDEDRRKAWEEWQLIATSPEAVAAIMAGLERWKKSDRWARGFIKVAFRWLRDGMWKEHPEPAEKKQPDQQPTTTAPVYGQPVTSTETAYERFCTVARHRDRYTAEQTIAAANACKAERPQDAERVNGWLKKHGFEVRDAG